MLMPWLLTKGSAPTPATDDLEKQHHPATGMESKRDEES
jgi:hypothetical protein